MGQLIQIAELGETRRGSSLRPPSRFPKFVAAVIAHIFFFGCLAYLKIHWRSWSINDLPHLKYDLVALEMAPEHRPNIASNIQRLSTRTPAEEERAGCWVIGIDSNGVRHDVYFRNTSADFSPLEPTRENEFDPPNYMRASE